MSDRCLHIFREMREKHLDFQDFCNVVGFIFCLPGSTAPVERIFSEMRQVLSQSLKNVNMLRKIASSEKYN